MSCWPHRNEYSVTLYINYWYCPQQSTNTGSLLVHLHHSISMIAQRFHALAFRRKVIRATSFYIRVAWVSILGGPFRQ